MILDTNALSAFVDGDPALGARLQGESHLALPVIVLGEFRYGIAASRHRATYERWLRDHVADFDVLPVMEATAVAYAAVRASLKRSGRPIPANDAWIAALAVQHGLRLLSRDEHSDHVPGVQRETW
jgi:predicted nucleic acid-binding protein